MLPCIALTDFSGKFAKIYFLWY